MLRKYSIKAKLGILAGVPVVGALVLASLLWIQALEGAQSARALGSVEDLAALSTGIGGLVHELQAERALQGLVLGHTGRAEDPLTSSDVAQTHRQLAEARRAQLSAQYLQTDQAHGRLDAFIHARSLEALPRRLRSEMEASAAQLQALSDIRADASGERFPLDERIKFFATLNAHLIGATNALTALSDDGELLRNIAALVSVMHVKERASQEQALLGSVFALDQFPAGSYRDFVTLTTQEEVYVHVLRANARDEQVALYDESMRSPQVLQALEMRQRALKTIDEPLQVEASAWFSAQAAKVSALRELEAHLSDEVHRAASKKLADIRTSIQRSLVLSIAVLLSSLTMALLISRGIAGSLSALSSATSRVRDEEDYSVRAVKQSQDEVGELAEAFNRMLDAIQHRDEELNRYRQGLEEQVEKRTQQLLRRNRAMRMVLDNVQQGLATIRPDGTLDSERSAVFDQWFGPIPEPGKFAESLGANDADVVATLNLAWEQVSEGVLPTELTIDQLPRQLTRNGRQFRLSYRPIPEADEATAALLVVNDVTAEVQQLKEQAEQREAIAIFENVVKDRSGFQSFLEETERLVASVVQNRSDRLLLLRSIHTVKGNCALFQIHSVAQECHETEEETEPGQYPKPEAIERIQERWKQFTARVRTLLGGVDDGAFKLRRSEWTELMELTQKQAPHGAIKAKLWELQLEPTQVRLGGFAEQAQRTAAKLGKNGLNVVVQDNGVRLPSERWKYFWANFAHVIRNAVDHGIEAPDDRERLGKPRAGTLILASTVRNDSVWIEVTDDGAGIAWEAVREKARQRGLPHASPGDLEAALFADGVTTRQQASEYSGRGVGMAAVRQVVDEMHGYVEIVSQPDCGTTFRFCVPNFQSYSRLPTVAQRSTG